MRKNAEKEGEKTAEELIKELTINVSDDEEKHEVLQSEALPGTCKSSYALQFRMQTEADNANFANVSLSLFLLITLMCIKIEKRNRYGKDFNQRQIPNQLLDKCRLLDQ